MKKLSFRLFISIFISCFITITVIISYYLYLKNPNAIIYEEKYYKFGTLVSVKISIPSNNQQDKIKDIFNKLELILNDLHIKWHPWEANNKNVLYRLNQALQKGKEYTVDKDTLNIIKTSKYISKITNNLFNPMNGKLYEIWGFHKEDFSKNIIPNKEEINQLISFNLTMDNIKINQNIISTNIKDPKIQKYIKLDFNAIAKGQIILIIKEFLESNHIKNSLINIGGDIYAMGYKDSNNKTYWTSAIFNPNSKNKKPIKILNLKPNTAIATSGNYFRNFIKDNNNYHHIINSNTGNSSNEITQVSVVHSDPLVSDALATAIMALDSKDIPFSNIEFGYLVVDSFGRVYSSF